MTCPHWHGVLDPCPACACGERVGAGLQSDVCYACSAPWAPWPWADRRSRALCLDCRDGNPWPEHPAVAQLDAWEADWRTRLGAHVQIEASWGFCRTWLPIHVRRQQLCQAAAKLRRMRA